jgi:hypothetical protein
VENNVKITKKIVCFSRKPLGFSVGRFLVPIFQCERDSIRKLSARTPETRGPSKSPCFLHSS